MHHQVTFVAVFFNNRREGPRTLYTLSPAYQTGIIPEDYFVVAIDNGSSDPLSSGAVEAFGPNFSYHYFDTESPSPAAALNWALKSVSTPFVACMIDGAHMLSPGIVRETQTALRLDAGALVYTLPFHLGPTLQNDSILSGYNQEKEDGLLESIPWRENGYLLFGISEVETANHSFFTGVLESNCFTVATETLRAAGGFDERFESPGGGLVNLDVFKKLVETPGVRPVALIGEASFHQFHGGVSTNVERSTHPFERFEEEYERIRGVPYSAPVYTPYYWGHFPQSALDYLPQSSYKDVIRCARRLVSRGKGKSAVDILSEVRHINVYDPQFHRVLGLAQLQERDFKAAEQSLRRSLDLAPHNLETRLALADTLATQGMVSMAVTVLREGKPTHREKPQINCKLAQIQLQAGDLPGALQSARKALSALAAGAAFQPPSYLALSSFFDKADCPGEAITALDLGIVRYPENAGFRLALGRLYVRQQNFDRAESCYEAALRFHTGKPTHIYLAMANCCRKQGHDQRAIEALKKALTHDPSHKRVNALLSELTPQIRSNPTLSI